jgi:histidine kinase
MSIRKRLFISNAVMIILPIILFNIYFILLHLFFGNELNSFTHWPGAHVEQNQPAFSKLTKTASLQPEKLLDTTYLDALSSELKKEQTGLIIRKGQKIIYNSSPIKGVDTKDIPVFGQEGYHPMVWLGNRPFSIRQHDFYFDDGKEGSILLINKNHSFPQFARQFFPLIIFGLLGIVILTNILLSYLMARSILKPVRLLSMASEKISRGDLNFHIQSNKKDELGKLVNAFDDMRKQLKRHNELRDQYENNRKELIASISHDLKTPITSIRGYVEGIMDGVANTEEKLKKYLETIHTKAEYMDRLINELFLYSKLEVNQVAFRFEKVKILPFIKDYLEELKLEFNPDQVQILLHASEPFPAVVRIDRDHIIRVMSNIIYNSIKYKDKGQCIIRISLHDQKDMIKVAITDNGPGVPREELPNIFHQFYRGDPSRRADTGGSGLGLAIASQIIKAHGGDIWGENSDDHGLIIAFTLPKADD